MKKFITFLLISALFINICGVSFASDNTYFRADGNWIKQNEYYEYRYVDNEGNESYRKITYFQKGNKEDGVFPDYEDHMVGDTRLIEDRFIEPGRYGDTELFGTIDSLFYRVLTIASVIVTKKLGKFIVTAASATGVEVDNHCEYRIRAYFSRDRVYKEGQVYIGRNRWKTYFTSGNREWYPHLILEDNEEGDDAILNCTHKYGFDPSKVDEARHFDDDDYILDRASLLFREGRNPEEEYGY